MALRPGFKTGLLLVLLFGCRTTPATSVWQELNAAQRRKAYQPMSEAQLSLAESLFKKMLRETPIRDERLAQAWSKLGYGLVQVSSAGGDWVGLREQASPCRGEGLYLVNRRIPGPLVVQAPHACYE